MLHYSFWLPFISFGGGCIYLTLASKHNWTGRGESEAGAIVPSHRSVVCQHVSVFLGNYEIDFLPVGKQYCKRGNHSHTMLCLTGLWEGKIEEHVVLVQNLHIMVGMVMILPTSAVYMSNIQLEMTLPATLKLFVFACICLLGSNN